MRVRRRWSIFFWSRGVAVNMPACHAGDRRFDPGRDRNFDDEHSDPAVFIFFVFINNH